MTLLAEECMAYFSMALQIDSHLFVGVRFPSCADYFLIGQHTQICNTRTPSTMNETAKERKKEGMRNRNEMKSNGTKRNGTKKGGEERSEATQRISLVHNVHKLEYLSLL